MKKLWINILDWWRGYPPIKLPVVEMRKVPSVKELMQNPVVQELHAATMENFIKGSDRIPIQKG